MAATHHPVPEIVHDQRVSLALSHRSRPSVRTGVATDHLLRHTRQLTARRVVQASNAAVPWLATIKPYQIFLCLGVSYDSVVAGFTGLSERGLDRWSAGLSTPSRSRSRFSPQRTCADFGVGASGLRRLSVYEGFGSSGSVVSQRKGEERVEFAERHPKPCCSKTKQAQ